MAEGNGDIVYAYAGSCTGSCAATWVAVKGTGLVSAADHSFPASFGQSNGQITYGGTPLYTYKSELEYQNHETSMFKSIALSNSLVITG